MLLYQLFVNHKFTKVAQPSPTISHRVNQHQGVSTKVVALSKTKNPRGQSQLDAVKVDLMCERRAYFAVNSGVSTQPAY